MLRLAVSDQRYNLAPALGILKHRRHVYSFLLHGTACGASCASERMHSVFHAVASGGGCDWAGPEQQHQRAYKLSPRIMQIYVLLGSEHSAEVANFHSGHL